MISTKWPSGSTFPNLDGTLTWGAELDFTDAQVWVFTGAWTGYDDGLPWHGEADIVSTTSDDDKSTLEFSYNVTSVDTVIAGQYDLNIRVLFSSGEIQIFEDVDQVEVT